MRSRLGRAVGRIRQIAFGQSIDADGERRDEALGQATLQRPSGLLLWFLTDTAHSASAAPAVAKALSERLEEPVHVIVTAQDNAPLVAAVQSEVMQQLMPVDTEGTIQRFLDHWRPDFGIVTGALSRPNLLAAAHKRNVPLFHTAAQRGDTSISARRQGATLALFTRCFAASASEANSLRSQLRDQSTRVEITGPLSDTIHALPCDRAECDQLALLLGGRPVWLAANVTTEEVEIVEAAHRKAFRSAHRLLLILVPRSGEDANSICFSLESLGWRIARRSQQEEPDTDTQIYIADTTDELGLWYRLAPTSFIGGSMSQDTEPTDPFDAASLGSAVLHGSTLGINPARFDALERNGASVQVSTADELADAVVTLLSPDKAASMAQAGWTVTTESAHVVERLAEVMEAHVLEEEGAL
ncbi:MAG: glycosyltransferase N-terminal domain-containing protein [Pseudomonadota bacterium]